MDILKLSLACQTCDHNFACRVLDPIDITGKVTDYSTSCAADSCYDGRCAAEAAILDFEDGLIQPETILTNDGLSLAITFGTPHKPTSLSEKFPLRKSRLKRPLRYVGVESSTRGKIYFKKSMNEEVALSTGQLATNTEDIS